MMMNLILSLVAIMIGLLPFVMPDKHYTPADYVNFIKQDHCDFELSKIDYKCDMAFEEVDHKTEMFFKTAEEFCTKSFASLDKLCKNKNGEICANEYSHRESNCEKRFDEVELYMEGAYEKLDNMCDAEYEEYDRKCEKIGQVSSVVGKEPLKASVDTSVAQISLGAPKLKIEVKPLPQLTEAALIKRMRKIISQGMNSGDGKSTVKKPKTVKTTEIKKPKADKKTGVRLLVKIMNKILSQGRNDENRKPEISFTKPKAAQKSGQASLIKIINKILSRERNDENRKPEISISKPKLISTLISSLKLPKQSPAVSPQIPIKALLSILQPSRPTTQRRPYARPSYDARRRGKYASRPRASKFPGYSPPESYAWLFEPKLDKEVLAAEQSEEASMNALIGQVPDINKPHALPTEIV